MSNGNNNRNLGNFNYDGEEKKTREEYRKDVKDFEDYAKLKHEENKGKKGEK